MIKRLFDTYGKKIKVEIETVKVNSKILKYPRIIQPDFVVILAISKMGILVERQYRYGIRNYVYQLPAGYIEVGEKPIDAAKRELQEETGYYPSRIRPMFKIFQAPAITNCTAYFYLAEKLIKREKHLDNAEILKVKFITVKKFESMIKNNLIEEQMAVSAYLYYKSYFKK